MVFRNNFGAIRYILAFAIFLSHFNVLTGSDLWFPISGYYRVCSFFVMSGFLIYGSFFRSTDWKDYLRNRAWRILPSYLIAVIACAILLFAVSDYPAEVYFTSSQWFKYLIANVTALNFIEPSLPGVFESHPETAVNGSLWTMKVEWMLYLFIIPVIWFTRRSGWRFWVVFLIILAFSVIYKMTLTYLAETTGKNLYSILAKQIGGQLAFFYSGVFLYTYLHHVKRWKYVIATISLCVLIAGVNFFGDHPLFSFLLFPLSLSGTVVSLAFIGTWGRWAEMFENCSYEIYLFHFPLIQLARHFDLTSKLGIGITFTLVFVITAATGYFVAKYISAPLRRAHRSSKRASALEPQLQ